MSEARAINLPVEEIEASAATQVRARIDPRHVQRLKEAIEDREAIVPPLVVFAERGSQRYLLADGFHRLRALKELEIREVACELHEGGVRHALRYALSANDTHGLPRNDDDKRNAVAITLKDPEWTDWNNVEISRMCRVSDTFVGDVRKALEAAGEIDPRETVKTRRRGKVVEQKAPTRSVEPTLPGQTSNKSTPPPKPRGPKSQDQINKEEFLAAVTAIRMIPHAGDEAIRRWKAHDQESALAYVYEWVGEALAECRKGKAA